MIHIENHTIGEEPDTFNLDEVDLEKKKQYADYSIYLGSFAIILNPIVLLVLSVLIDSYYLSCGIFFTAPTLALLSFYFGYYSKDIRDGKIGCYLAIASWIIFIIISSYLIIIWFSS